MLSAFRYLLAQPEVRGVDLDSPGTVDLHRRLTLGKPFLRNIYEDWYAWLGGALPEGEGRVLELGSGGGFLRDQLVETIASDIVPSAHVDVVLDGQLMPFADDALRGIIMTNVLHHIPDVRLFLEEASRCVRPGGVVAMIEPWFTRWSRFVYGTLHHEEMRPDAADWAFESDGPMSSANVALPWILFARDRSHFEEEFPHWRIDTVEPFMPLRYLLSGGVSVRTAAGRVRARRRAKLIATGAGLAEGKRALELGCGTGLFTSMFAETGADLVAVDISPDLLALARERGLPQGKVLFLEKRFEDCEIDRPFDAVIGSSVLHHLDLEEAFSHIFDLLVPGGVLSFAEPNMLNPQVYLERRFRGSSWMSHISPDETAFVRWTLARQMRAAGFEAVSMILFDWLHPRTPAACIGLVRFAGSVVEKIPAAREFAGSLHIIARRPA